MKDLLKFWSYINENFDEDSIEEAVENNEVNVDVFQEHSISNLSEEILDNLFGDIINVFMDVAGTDNYGDVYDVLKNIIGMDESRIDELLS